MPKRGKRYQEVAQLVDRDEKYAPEKAVELAKQTSYGKFDATIEVHLRMGLDPRKADQQIRSTVQLPHGTGKVVRVLVFAEGEDQKAALDAGADFALATTLYNKFKVVGLILMFLLLPLR